MTPSISVFGSFTIDDLVFPDGTTRWAVPGGAAVYAALGAALWTEPVSIVAPLGSDYPVEELGQRIDLTRCRPIQHTLRNWGLYEEGGQRHFVSRSVSRRWADFCPCPEDADGAQRAAHLAPMPRNVTAAIAQRLREQGTMTLSLDLDDHDLLGWGNSDELMALLRQVDLFLPSQRDMLALFPALTLAESLHTLREMAPHLSLIAIKCGAEGVLAHAMGMSTHVHIPVVAVEAKDATGAGDAFCGGVLAGIALDKDPLEALQYGCVSASFCVEGFGFRTLAATDRAEADARLKTLRTSA